MDNIVINLAERTYPMLKDTASRFVPLEQRDFQNDYNFVPFGEDYSGELVLRHPNLGDKTKIEAVQKRELHKAGFNGALQPSFAIEAQEYGFAVVEVLGVSKPEWLNRDTLYSELDQHIVGEIGRAFVEAVESKKKKSTVASTNGSLDKVPT